MGYNSYPAPTVSRVLWLIWCGMWSALWFIAAAVQFGVNPFCDLMVLVSAGCMFLPIGSHRARVVVIKDRDNGRLH